jgi:hypothetical protein
MGKRGGSRSGRRNRLDLRRSAKRIEQYLAERVRDYPEYVNEGPGRDEDPITQITLGYQFDQAGWIVLVFDTRPGAEIDGEWNSYIDENLLDVDDWYQAFEALWDDDVASIELTLLDGSRTTLGQDCSMDDLAGTFGEMLRDVLVGARDGGLLTPLPLADGCVLVVEHQEGHYGWSDPEGEGAKSERAYLAGLEGDVSSKPVDGQISHWIHVLDRIASGKESEAGWGFLAPDHALRRLRELGQVSAVPLLRFVRRWAGKPEWEGDRPGRQITELPMQTPTIDALMMLCEVGWRSHEVELLLCEIVRKSVKANAERKLWGIMPVWAARCLSCLFDGYPEPQQNSKTNALMNRDEFTRKRRRQA